MTAYRLRKASVLRHWYGFEESGYADYALVEEHTLGSRHRHNVGARVARQCADRSEVAADVSGYSNALIDTHSKWDHVLCILHLLWAVRLSVECFIQ